MTPVTQPELARLLEGLRARNAAEGYACLKQLLAESGHTAAVYPHWDALIALTEEESAYLRARGLLLLAANARWDTENRLDRDLERLLAHLTDKKPTVARQFLAALPQVAQARPDLAPRLRQALLCADTSAYPDSTRTLVEKDLRAALNALQTPAG